MCNYQKENPSNYYFVRNLDRINGLVESNVSEQNKRITKSPKSNFRINLDKRRDHNHPLLKECNTS